MNKIYKVIWSKVKHQYVVTSEFAHSCTKSTTSRVGKSALAALAAFVLTAGVGGVQAAGENAVSEGPGSSAAADNSVAIGKNARVDEWSPAAIAIGKDSFVHGPYSVAIGEGSSTSRENAVALGRNSHANGAGSVALGYHTDAQAEDSVALGDFSKATKANTVSVGNATLKRQIVNVAAGTDADDVVTVGQLQDPSDKATKTIHGVTLDNGTIEAANGNFAVGEDGTTHIRAGQSQIQVRDDLTGLNYGSNSVIVNRDGVTLTGDVAADNSIKVGLVGYDADNDFAPIYGTEMGADGSFSTAQGSFRVDKDGNVWAANGDVTIDADGTTYIHAGQSELQVTDNQAVLRHGNNGVIVNNDGVSVAGDLAADNGLKVGVAAYDSDGNGIYNFEVGEDGSLRAAQGNFTVDADGTTYVHAGQSELQVTDTQAVLRHGTNGVIVNNDGVSIAGDLKLDGALDTGDLDADSLYVADGKFTVDSDGTMYSQVGKSQLQVRGDYVGMNYGPNTSIGLNEDGVTVRGDVSVEDDLRIGDKIYFGNDGSLAMGNGAFSVDPDGQLSVGYGKATINKYGVITASNMYIGDSANENNRVVTKGELGQAVDGAVTEATEGAVKWDKDDSGNYTNSINGVGLEDGNVTADTVTTTGDVNVGGDLNVDGSLTVGGETVATGADVSGIKGQIGVNEDGGYKTINNGASDVITGINNNTTAINEVKTTVGSGKLDNGAADLTSGINQNTAAIAQNSQAINSLGHRVSDLGDEIDSVGAISAALAGLHPLDYDGTGSKFQISAAMGTYDGTQAAAIGGFYHFNRDVMLSLGGATSFEGDKKTAANIGVTFRVGEGASGKSVSDDVMARLEAMDQKIAALEQENKDLKNVLGAIDTSLSKEFPDVPANHWAYEAVTKLAGNDVVAGYPDGEFHGDRTMTRYEMAEIIYKAMSKGVQVDQKLVNEFKPEMEQVAANQNA